MVIYEYICETCGERFELECLYGEPDPHPVSCPSGHCRIRRVYSAPRVFFKGSGFYVNDSGRSSKSSTSK